MNPTDLLPPELLEEDPLLDASAQLEESARLLDLEDWIVQRLKHPEREITVNLPLQRDLGDAVTCAAYRVQHYRGRGGCLGPVLLAPDAHPALLRPLALHMTLQCALFDLPLGGSAGAIVCDPNQLSETELRQLVSDYLDALRDLDSDVFAPAEFAAAWTSRNPHSEAIVGKPAAIGGLPDPPAVIAAGWFTVICEALAAQNKSVAESQSTASSHQPPRSALHNCRVSLQGFTPSAAALARKLQHAGARVIALADQSGGLFAERGLDLDAVSAHAAQHGMLFGFADADPVRNADVLECDGDILITSAAQRQLTAQNATRVRAPLILDAAYNAITPAAQRILASRKAFVIPDLLAPATLAWFAEWQHGMQYALPGQARVEAAVRDALAAAFHLAQAHAVDHGCSFADACHLLAVQKAAANLRLTH